VEKVNDATAQSLETATAGIREKLESKKAKELAFQKAEAIYNTVYDGDDLATAGQNNGVSPRATDFFSTRTFKEKGISDSKLFVDAAFSLDKMSISEILDLGNAYVLLQVADRKPSAIPELESVIEKVRTDLEQKRRDELAKADAEKCLAELRDGKPFKDVESQFDLKAIQTGAFKRSDSIPKIGYEPQVSEAAFKLKADEPLPKEVFKGKKGWYVIQFKNRQSTTKDNFTDEKEGIIQRLTQQKKQSTFQQWLNELRAASKVEINRKLIQ